MTIQTVQNLHALGQAAQKAARKLARLSTEDKNAVLMNLVDLLRSDQKDVLEANRADYEEAESEDKPKEKKMDQMKMSKMDMGNDRYFLEETSLGLAPPLTIEKLQERLSLTLTNLVKLVSYQN